MAEGRRPTTRDRVRAVLALGSVLGLGAVGTLAAWTDESTATSGSFSTGTVDLRLAAPGGTGGTDTFAFSTFSATNLRPGSVQEGTLTVLNAGTLPFRYTLASSATSGSSGALVAQLGLSVLAGGCGGTVVSASGSTLASVGLDAPRTLAAGASETLCFRATLPAAAPSSLQGLTAAATFTFTATST